MALMAPRAQRETLTVPGCSQLVPGLTGSLPVAGRRVPRAIADVCRDLSDHGSWTAAQAKGVASDGSRSAPDAVAHGEQGRRDQNRAFLNGAFPAIAGGVTSGGVLEDGAA
jgi:hypothetical protein